MTKQNKNKKSAVEFPDKAIVDAAFKKDISLPELCIMFPGIDKTRIAHRIESLKKSRHLIKTTTVKVSYYRAGYASPV